MISQLFLMSSAITNSFFFSKMKHPMSMGIMLLIQTVIISMITGGMAQNAWFSYILFLVFLGGMLVLFIYMTSVASNDLFGKSNNYIMLITSYALMTTILIILTILDPMNFINNSEESLMMTEVPQLMSLSLFNFPNSLMTILAVIYLFFTLIVVVNISEVHQGPLRSSN